MHLKSVGALCARTLSYESCEFELIDGISDVNVQKLYNQATEVWTDVSLSTLFYDVGYYVKNPVLTNTISTMRIPTPYSFMPSSLNNVMRSTRKTKCRRRFSSGKLKWVMARSVIKCVTISTYTVTLIVRARTRMIMPSLKNASLDVPTVIVRASSYEDYFGQVSGTQGSVWFHTCINKN